MASQAISDALLILLHRFSWVAALPICYMMLRLQIGLATLVVGLFAHVGVLIQIIIYHCVLPTMGYTLMIINMETHTIATSPGLVLCIVQCSPLTAVL